MSRPHLIATQDGLTAEIADPRLSSERLNRRSGHCPVYLAYPALNTPYGPPGAALLHYSGRGIPVVSAGKNALAALQGRFKVGPNKAVSVHPTTL